MNKKLFSAILEALGLQEGEEFTIKHRSSIYTFKDGELQYRTADSPYWVGSTINVNQLLNAEIILPPFSPQLEQKYWTYIGDTYITGIVEEVWRNNIIDCMRKATGCVFRSHEEAFMNMDKKIRELKGE